MRVDVRPARNWFHSLANRAAIFDDCFVQRQIAHRNLVAERHVIEQLDFANGLAFQRERADGGAFLEVGHGNADIVFRFVQQNTMFHIQIDLFQFRIFK